MGTQLAGSQGMAAGLRSGWHWVSRATVTSGSVWCHAGIERSLFYPVSLRWIGCHLDQLQASYQQGWRGILWLGCDRRFPIPFTSVLPRTRNRCCFSSVFETAIGRQAALKLAVELSSHNKAIGLALTTGLMKMMKFGWSIYGTTFSLSEKTCRW